MIFDSKRRASILPNYNFKTLQLYFTLLGGGGVKLHVLFESYDWCKLDVKFFNEVNVISNKASIPRSTYIRRPRDEGVLNRISSHTQPSAVSHAQSLSTVQLTSPPQKQTISLYSSTNKSSHYLSRVQPTSLPQIQTVSLYSTTNWS